jgi:hypothetical protein
MTQEQKGLFFLLFKSVHFSTILSTDIKAAVSFALISVLKMGHCVLLLIIDVTGKSYRLPSPVGDRS